MNMTAVRKLTIYLDRASQQWIVRDADGNFWSVPSEDNGWEHRQPFWPKEETELEPVPSHYKYVLGLFD
jgi:hypothetical protein